MIQLISKSNIASVQVEDGGRGGSGAILFRGGELYSGEISGQVPSGFGHLSLRDGSSFEGRFEGAEISEGTFAHFSGVRFSGKFVRNRFSRGTLALPDGDSLEGAWGPESGRWVLRSGRLLDQWGEVQRVLAPGDIFESQSKSVSAGGPLGDFSIKWPRFAQVSGKELKNFSLFADGTACFERAEGFSLIRTFSSRATFLPTVSREPLSKAQQKLSWHRLAFGAEVELNRETEVATLRFDAFPKAFVRGTYQNDPTQFKFKGALFDQRPQLVSLGSVSVKASVFATFSVKFDGERFEQLEAFFQKLKKIGVAQKDDKTSSILPKKHSLAEKPSTSLSVLKMMVTTMMAGASKDMQSTEASD